jgi:hypothetical protein
MSKNKTEVIVSVTESHIKRGSEGDPHGCPVALALRSKKYTFGPGLGHGVGQDTISFFNRSGRTVEIETPKQVSKFINRFDAGKKVKPFSFKLSY